MTQLPLNLAFEPRYGHDDFLVTGSNAEAYGAIRRWPDWPDRIALLVGPTGSGKTHLAAIWAEQAGARMLSGGKTADPRSFGGRTSLIDDVDAADGNEGALFHALNIVRDSGGALLLTARRPPDRWGLQTPDLLSRLRLAPLFRLDPPGDDLLRAVLVKLFVDRQLIVDNAVIEYVALRMDRSLGMARTLVDAIDRASLAAGRRITRPIAAEALATILDLA